MLDTPIAPPLDGSITVLPGLVDFHAKRNPQHPCVLLAHEDGLGETSLSFEEYAQATHRIAHTFRPGRQGADGEIVAILIHCDALLYLALIPGLVRAGIIPVPMSTGLTAASIASVLKQISCRRIISQPSFAHVIEGVQQELAKEGQELVVHDLPSVFSVFSGIPGYETLPKVTPYPESTRVAEKADIVFYLLSSGSSGAVPKPLPQRQETLIQWCNSPCISKCRSWQAILNACALPLFHLTGIYCLVCSPNATGRPVAVFYPRFPDHPTVPTPKNTLQACRATRTSMLVVSPSFLAAWARCREDVRYLATMTSVMFGGALLPEKVGLALEDAGVNLYSGYGLTETGVHTALRDDKASGGSTVEEHWRWLQFSSAVKPRWVPQGDGTYELELLTCDTHWPAVENLEDTRGFATNDLFVPHPKEPDLWKIIGRKDDVMSLSSSENVFPIAQEHIILLSGLAAGVVLFGEGRSYCGLLVEPNPDFAINPNDLSAVQAMRERLWPVVTEANQIAHSSSRVAKSMIIFTDPCKPPPRSQKGTVVRKLSLARYSKEIEDLYASMESTTAQQAAPAPLSWSTEDIRRWLTSHMGAEDDPASQSNWNPTQIRFNSFHIHRLHSLVVAALECDLVESVRALAPTFSEDVILRHPTITELAAGIEEFVAQGGQGRVGVGAQARM